MNWLREWATGAPLWAFVTVWLLNKWAGGKLARRAGVWDEDRLWDGTSKLLLGMFITVVAAGLQHLGAGGPTEVLQFSAFQLYPTYVVGKKLRPKLKALFDGPKPEDGARPGEAG